MTVTANLSSLAEPPLVEMSYRERLHHALNFHTGCEAFRDAAGPVVRVSVLPGRVVLPMVIATSPTAIRDVLAADGHTIDKDATIHRQTRLWGLNVFNMLHSDWLPRRRLLQPVFTKKHVEGFAGHMAAAATQIADEWADQGQVSLNSATRDLTLRVLGRSLFGIELQEDAARLEESVARQLLYVTRRGILPLRAPQWLPTPARARFRHHYGVVREVAERGLLHAEAGGDAELVRLLSEAHDPVTGDQLTRDQIIDELVVFLLAGHDTTATTLAYALWQLGRHPELQDRVADEVAGVDLDSLTANSMRVLPETVKVLHEALRLCPPGAVVGRSSTQDLAVDGYRVVAGTQIIVGIYAVQRDRTLWGEDADEFRPDRFDEAEGAHRNRWAFLPFGAGHRSCIGDHFAMTEAAIAVAGLLQRLRFTSLEDDFPLALPFTMTAGGPIPVTVTRR